MFQFLTLSTLLVLNPVYSCIEQEHPKIVLYYTDRCPYSQKILEYLNKTHKTVSMKNVGSNPEYKEELLKVGGKLQVPCLIVDGKAIYDSDAIIQWLSKHQDCLESSS